MKILTIVLTALFLSCPASLCPADDDKGHVCFRSLDSNQDGIVTYQEFEKYYGNDEEKFNQADADKDGKLTHNEYHDLLGHGSP